MAFVYILFIILISMVTVAIVGILFGSAATMLLSILIIMTRPSFLKTVGKWILLLAVFPMLLKPHPELLPFYVFPLTVYICYCLVTFVINAFSGLRRKDEQIQTQRAEQKANEQIFRKLSVERMARKTKRV
jgi:hypothetical protein